MDNIVRIIGKTILSCWLSVAFMVLSHLTVAQDLHKISGVIIDENNSSIPGVSIVVKNTNRGTVTDADGKYTIDVGSNETIVISSIGYKTQEVAVDSRSIIDVSLTPDTKSLEEVIVVGYGTMTKSHLTGAVAKVTNEKLDQIPLSRIDDALTGQLSGINVQQTNPAAGEAPKINVRGFGTITGSSDPLIVVDGIVVGSDYLASISMNDVESVEVLKDAASVSIYGSRGANGIIMITSKKGKAGATRFSYSSYVGSKSVPRTNILSTVGSWSDYVRANNNGELTDQMKAVTRMGTNTNWEKVMMDGGLINNHALSASGGSENTKFNASMSYMNDAGVLLTDNFSKLNFRLNLDTKIGKGLEYGIMLNPSYSNQRRFPIGLQDAIRQSPWLPIYLDQNSIQYVNRLNYGGAYANAQVGDYAVERMFDNWDLVNNVPTAKGGTSIVPTGNTNPYAMVVEQHNNKYETKFFANTYLKVKLMKGLYYKATLGGNFRYTEYKNWTGTKATQKGASGTSANFNTDNEIHMVTEHTLNYNKDINRHSITAVAGYAMETWHEKLSYITGVGYQSDLVQTIGTNNVGSGGAYTNENKETLISYLGRVNYAYADKYLVSLSARTDGSSKFGPNNKFGFFPAVSAGWRISQENFLKNSRVISDLKFRLSYGTSGSNSGIGRYAALGIMSQSGAVLNGNVATGYNQLNIANPNLKWEKLVEINPGLDAEFFSGRFGLSFNYYDRVNNGLLLNQPIQSTSGFQTALVNLGKVDNRGFEIDINTKNVVSGKFSWTSVATVTRNKNTLLSLPGANGLISTVDSKRPAQWIAKEGNPISSFYGYVATTPVDPKYLVNAYYPIGANARDVYVKDLNGDGVITTADQKILGSPYPKIIWSLTNNFKYGNFDFSFMFQSSQGAKTRNIDPQYLDNQFSINMVPNGSFPDAALVQQKIFTDQQIMNASYLALRNINLGYKLPKSITAKFHLRQARLYVAAQNLLYIKGKGYIGYNPEGIYESSGTANTPLTYGYQRGAAPIYRTISAGINLEF